MSIPNFLINLKRSVHKPYIFPLSHFYCKKVFNVLKIHNPPLPFAVYGLLCGIIKLVSAKYFSTRSKGDLFMKKSIKSYILAGILAVSLSPASSTLQTAEAIDWTSFAGAGIQYFALEKELKHLDNGGRNEFFEQMKKKYGVNNDPRANAMLDRIMTRLSASIAKTDPSITKKPYNYFVNDDKSFNAFCTIGHNLSVNIGAFEPLNYNENELAFVLAHEMGHGQKGHPIQGIRKQMPLVLAGAAIGGDTSTQLITGILSQVGTAKLITKPMEKEADALAFTYAVNAGYNIGAGAAVWQRILDKNPGQSSGGINELFNDHPSTISRRNVYNEDITKWSGGVVKVNADTGMISLHGKDWYQPETISSMSSKERAYLIAGNLSAVYHDGKKPTANDVHRGSDNLLYVGAQPIMDLSAAQNPTDLTNRLQQLI